MFRHLAQYSVLTDEADGLTPQIPSHWERRRLGSMFSRRGSGTTPQGDGYYGGAIPFVLTGDLRDGVVRKTPRTVTRDAVRDYAALKVYPENTLLVAMYTATMGRTALLGVEAACNQASCAFYSPREGIDVRFVQLATQVSRPQLMMAAAGGVQANVNAEKVGRLLLSLPPANEQTAIVKYLGHAHARIDRAIAAKRKLIALLEEQKQAIVHEAVTRGLDPFVPLKDSGLHWLGEIPAHWEQRRVGTLFREVVMKSTTGDEASLSMSQKLGLVPSEQVERSLGSESMVGGKLCEPNDLVLNRLKAHLGVFAIARQSGVVSPDYTVLRPSAAADPAYYEYVMKSKAVRLELRVRAKGIVEGFWRLYTNDLYTIVVPAPPIDEQRLIVARLADINREVSDKVNRIVREIELLHEFRTRLTSDVVTGQVDVREIAATLPELTDEAIMSVTDEFDDEEIIDAELEFASANE